MTTPKRAFHPEIRHRLIISGLSAGEGTNVLCVCMYCIYRKIYIPDYSGLGEASENGPFWAPFPPCTLSLRCLTALRIWILECLLSAHVSSADDGPLLWLFHLRSERYKGLSLYILWKFMMVLHAVPNYGPPLLGYFTTFIQENARHVTSKSTTEGPTAV